MKNMHLCSKSFILLFLLVTWCVSVQAKASGKQRLKNISHHHTKAILTLNSFEKGGDGGGPSECDNKFHSDNTPIVALSSRWFNHGKRCHRKITIFGNGRRVDAIVVDECDSSKGCGDNVVDGSKAVWRALGLNSNKGVVDIFWSDA